MYTVKKPGRNAPNSDVDNGGAEPKDVGVGIYRHPHSLVRATVVHIGISHSFFYSVLAHYTAAPVFLGERWSLSIRKVLVSDRQDTSNPKYNDDIALTISEYIIFGMKCAARWLHF